MKILQIKTSDELKVALASLDVLLKAEHVKELDELDALATLISDYEDKNLIKECKNQAELDVKINV
ncbi:MAG: antitoxin component HigA of HigAB toxin-antitoxin module [Oleiphilaceae bacterium]|jgi:antitoxin component HigA of HigAB toxin-antitoxin module